VVLGYIRNETRKFHIFVANRVQIIHDETDVKRWFYISTDQNPADLASCGSSCDELLASVWFKGPSFLMKSEIEPESETVFELATNDPDSKNICDNGSRRQSSH
jgi:hypothetical protein